MSMQDAPRDNEAVRQFFDRWHLYQKIATHDYLNHRGAYAAIAKKLSARKSPFSFLELGCGDALWTSAALAQSQLLSYDAMDLSSVALDLAAENLQGIDCPKHLAQADFFEALPTWRKKHDVIFIGLSFHHLPTQEKAAFFPAVHRALNPGGSFLFYEPIRKPTESREEVFARTREFALQTWTELTPDELDQACRHIAKSDYQEPIEAYFRMAKNADFQTCSVLYVDPHDLYAVLDCER